MARTHRPFRARHVVATGAAACLLLLPIGSRAQEADSTVVADSARVVETPPDSLLTRRSSVLVRIPAIRADTTARYSAPDAAPVPGGTAVNLRWWSGAADTLILPVVAPALDTEHLLATVPGSFLYDLGAPGWPHGWSPDGLNPASIGLTAFGLSWNDPVTGRPRFDLLPAAFFEPLTLEPSTYGGVVGVSAELREHAAPRPITELRYWKGASNLQSVVTTHAQRRRLNLFGGSELSVLGGYGGRASAGEYPGSRLRRERHVLGRVGLARPSWYLDLFDLHTRHQVGAHGGVLERPGLGPESVYDRFGARVENERATRRTVRNDLVAELGLPLRVFRAQPVVRGFWTAQSFRYRDPRDTISVDTDRVGATVALEKRTSRDVMALSGSIISEHDGLNWTAEEARHMEYHVGIVLGITRGRFSARAKQAIKAAPVGNLLSTVDASYAGRRWGGFVHYANGSDPATLIYEHGFGSLVRPLDAEDANATRLIRVGTSFREGPLALRLEAFASRTSSGAALIPVSGDTAAVTAAEAVRRLGITLELGLREEARRGFYMEADATTVRISGAGAFTKRIEESLPTLFGTARGGMRYRLFRGDLDLHVYLQARAWSAFRSRVLHAPTGLLILPEATADELGPSSSLGLYVEAGVREATLFIAWENLAAGTALTEGTMLVPVYPLPEQALRFGVFWPIQD